MASTAPVQDAGVLLTWENVSNVVEGSLAVLGSQRSEGGFTIYRIVFKVWYSRSPCGCISTCTCIEVSTTSYGTHLQVWSQNPDGISVFLEVSSL